MTETPENNPLDKFFRDSIESSEAKPSEQFWNRAYESIIVREGKMNRTGMLAWRSAAILLALFMTGFISYSVYISGKVNGLRSEVANIEKVQAEAASAKTGNSHITATAGHRTDATIGGSSHTAAPAVFVPVTVPANTSAPIRRGASMHGTITAAGTHANSVQRAMVAFSGNNTTSQLASPAGSNMQISVATANSNKIASGISHSQSPGSALATTNSRFLAFKSLFNPTTVGLLPYLNAIYPGTTKSTETMMPDSALMVEQDPAEKVQNYFMDVMLPKFSLAGFFSINNLLPAMIGYNPVENITSSQMNANEQKQQSFSAGINIGYDLSPRFTIQAGCNYQLYRFTIAPTPLNVNGNDLTGYQFETSSGTVNLPWLPGMYGAAATAQGNAIRSYYCVPVQLKWNFVADRKLKLYLTAGAAANILAENSASIVWENAYGSSHANINGMDGTNIVGFSYLAGLGAEYKLSRGFSAYVEGTYFGSLTPVSSGLVNYINVKSNLISEAVGIRYHL